MTTKNIELSHEVILAIELILKIDNAPYSDSLDTLSYQFNPIPTLNELFPNGPEFQKLMSNYHT